MIAFFIVAALIIFIAGPAAWPEIVGEWRMYIEARRRAKGEK